MQLKKKMNDIVVDKAKVASIVEYIDKIVVFQEYLEIHINTRRSLGVESSIFPDVPNSVLKLPVTCATGRHDVIGNEEKIIMKAMVDNPKMTVKQIAKTNGWPLSRANRRVAVMKSKGWIKYTTPNGKGEWVVLKNRE